MAELKTSQEMAELYQGAIDNLLTGKLQSYTIPGRGSFQKVDLPALERAYRYWLAQAREESGEGGSVVAYVDMNRNAKGDGSTSA